MKKKPIIYDIHEKNIEENKLQRKNIKVKF